MAQWLEVIPAYGRDYSSQAKVKQDWNANKDFRIPGGPVINKQDADMHNVNVIARYNKNQNTVIVRKAK